MRKFLISISAIFLSLQTCLAQELSLKAEIEPESVKVGEQLTYKVTLEYKEENTSGPINFDFDMEDLNFEEPSFQGFSIVSNYSFNNVNIVNNVKVVKAEWTYVLELLDSNVNEIEPSKALLEINGEKKIVKSNPISFDVKGGVVEKKVAPFEEDKSLNNENKIDNGKSSLQEDNSEEIKEDENNNSDNIKNNSDENSVSDEKTQKESQTKTQAKEKVQNKINNSYGILPSEDNSNDLIYLILFSSAFVLIVALASWFLIRLLSKQKEEDTKQEEEKKNEEKKTEEEIDNILKNKKPNKEKFLDLAKKIREKLEGKGQIKYSMTIKQLKKLVGEGQIKKEVFEILEIAELAEFGNINIDEEALEKAQKIAKESF